MIKQLYLRLPTQIPRIVLNNNGLKIGFYDLKIRMVYKHLFIVHSVIAI